MSPRAPIDPNLLLLRPHFGTSPRLVLADPSEVRSAQPHVNRRRGVKNGTEMLGVMKRRKRGGEKNHLPPAPGIKTV